MSRASKEEDIKALVSEIDPSIQVGQNFVYGYTDASLMTSLVYGNLAAVMGMEYFIVVFTENRLLMLKINMGGSLTGNYGMILYSDIESFKVRKGLMQYILTVQITGEKKKLKLKSNKKMLGMGWQKSNLEHLDSRGWNGLSNKG